MTWGVIGRPALMPRCCIRCGCVACIIVAAAATTMHPEHPGCIRCITGCPGERRPAGAHRYEERAGSQLITHHTRLTWQLAAPIAPDASSRPGGRTVAPPRLSRRPRDTLTHHQAADVAGMRRAAD